MQIWPLLLYCLILFQSSRVREYVQIPHHGILGPSLPIQIPPPLYLALKPGQPPYQPLPSLVFQSFSDRSGLRICIFNKFPGDAAAAGPLSWLWVALLYTQLSWRKRCQGLQGYLRRAETRTVFKCDAWEPSVMGTCTHSVQWYLTTSSEPALWLPEQKPFYMLLKDIMSGADVGYPSSELCHVFPQPLFSTFSWWAVASQLAAWNDALPLWKSEILRAHWKAAACLGPSGLRDINHWVKGLWELPHDGSKCCHSQFLFLCMACLVELMTKPLK